MFQSAPSALEPEPRDHSRHGLLADAPLDSQPRGLAQRGIVAWLWLVCLATAGWGCTQTPTQGAAPASKASAEKPATRRGQRTENGQITLETGSFQAGTEPGQWSRDPGLEPTTFELQLGEFSIDQFAYPNEENAPSLLGQSQTDASRLCGEKGGRLCTELEWERACRGTQGAVFSTGKRFDCLGTDCATPEQIYDMGRAPEWTASFFGESSKLSGSAVIKGGFQGEDEASHRCAHRAPPGKTTKNQMSFRCCYGAPNAAKIKEPTAGVAFALHKLSGKKLKQLLDSDERTQGLSKDLVFFSDPEASRTVLSRGTGDTQGFDFTVKPLIWRPVAGAKFLVVVGKSGKDTSFVVAYHSAANGTFTLAASFIMHSEPGPVAIAYSNSIRPRLHFSSCWGCPGETAKLLYRHPDRLVALQP